MTLLRQFLYRDEPLITEFLSQVEGGTFDQQTDISREGRTRGASVGLQTGPARAGVDREREQSVETERVVRQTGASEFERLYNALEAADSIQFLENVDDEIWQQLSRGEILEIEAVIQRTGLGKIAELLTTFTDLIPVAELAGASVSLDDEQTQILNAVKGLTGTSKSGLDVIITLAAAPKYRLGSTLRAEHLLVEPDVLEGEATVVGKIQRKLRKGESHLMGNLFGGLERLLDKASKKKLAGIFDSPEIRQLGTGNPRIAYPGAVLTPIAIYR